MTSTTLFSIDRLPAPDELGFFFHPDIPGEEESDDVASMLKAMGFEWATRSFDEDADEADVNEWFDSPQRDIIIRWEPTPPSGDGWNLIAKGDTDDGPFALFVRPAIKAEADKES